MKAIIVGCGSIGQKRAYILKRLGIDIVLCIDTNLINAKYLAEKYECEFSDHISEHIQDLNVEVAFIATPHKFLTEIAIKLVSKKINVFLEKPGSISSSELENLRELTLKNKIILAFGYNHRFHSSVLKAYEIHKSGVMGSPIMLRGRYGHGGRVGYDREWRSNKELSGGGELIDQGSHLIDLAHLFMGDSIQVDGFASTLFWDMEVDDNAFITLKSCNNCVSQIHVSCSEWKNLFSLEIYYAKGKLHLEGLGGSYGLEKLTYYKMLPKMGPPPSETWEWPEKDNSWEIEIKEFLKGVNSNRLDKYLVDVDSAIKNLRVVEKIYRNQNYRPAGKAKSFELINYDQIGL